MMNKKRLAALALSAVMAAGTVSIPVNAADFSDGAAVQEEVAVQSVDVTEEDQDAAAVAYYVDQENAEWDKEKGTVSFTLISSDGKEKVPYKDQQAQKKQVTAEATCETGEVFQWVYTAPNGENILSPSVTGEKLGHDYQTVDPVYDPAPTCTTPGFLFSGKRCTRCGAWDTTDPSYSKVEVLPSHNLEGQPDIIEYTDLRNVRIENNKPVLVNTNEDGYYNKVTKRKCLDCGTIEIVDVEEDIKITASTAEVAYSKVTTDTTKFVNIAKPETITDKYINDVPANDKIELSDCTKEGSYVVVHYNANNEVVSEETVTVPAHHMTVLEGKCVDDKEQEQNLLSFRVDEKTGKLIVTSNTCAKDVKYYEITRCTADGCKLKDKIVSKVEKVAPKSTKHLINNTVKANIEKIKTAGEPVDYSVLKEAGVDEKNVKVVLETATCETAGTVSVEFYCQACGQKVSTITGVKVKALQHLENDPVVENEKEATCETAGTYDLVTYCQRCNKEVKRIAVTGQRLPHTNEKVELGRPVDDTSAEAIKKSDVVIDFKGGIVYGDPANTEYAVGGKFPNTIGVSERTVDEKTEKLPTLSTHVFTNCAVCHNNLKELANQEVTIEVLALTKETTDKYNVVTKAGTITLKATYVVDDERTITAETTVPYISDYKLELADSAKTGLVKDPDGVYRYYINGDFAEDYAGIAEYGDGEFFVANGLICTDANGLNLYDGTWYMLANGQIQRNYNGLALYDGQWFYLTNGELDAEINGIVNYDGGQFLVINGRLGGEVNGLWQNFDGEWYYLANGQVQNQYTGVAQYDGAFFYVVNGVLDSDYNGTVEYDGETFKVVNGMLQ